MALTRHFSIAMLVYKRVRVFFFAQLLTPKGSRRLILLKLSLDLLPKISLFLRRQRAEVELLHDGPADAPLLLGSQHGRRLLQRTGKGER